MENQFNADSIYAPQFGPSAPYCLSCAHRRLDRCTKDMRELHTINAAGRVVAMRIVIRRGTRACGQWVQRDWEAQPH
jgi:hypothetical protein